MALHNLGAPIPPVPRSSGSGRVSTVSAARCHAKLRSRQWNCCAGYGFFREFCSCYGPSTPNDPS